MTNVGSCQTQYTSTGRVKYQIELRNDFLNKYHVVHGTDSYIVQEKARAYKAQWDALEQTKRSKSEQKENAIKERDEKKQLAEDRTNEAQEALRSLENILHTTLNKNDAVKWDTLKDFSKFHIAKPVRPNLPEPVFEKFPHRPERTDAQFKPRVGILDRLFTNRMQKRLAEAEALFQASYKNWYEQCMRIDSRNKEARRNYENSVKQTANNYTEQCAQWEKARQAFLEEQRAKNGAVDQFRERYCKKDREAIIEYCENVLGNSQYPDYFPQSYELEYNDETSTLIVSYQLPEIHSLPTRSEVKYVPSKDEFVEKHITDKVLAKTYDGLLYRICLRTIHELYEADVVNAVESIVFNGFVAFIDPANGKASNPCIMSLQVGKQEFGELNLESIDPKPCFKMLKGVGSAQLHSITPIPPIKSMQTEDRRFVESYLVAENLDGEYNLAAMPWEDFEHLIRELFEREFSSEGSVVKVTQASRDGGVDAVAFDPDPVRGGKIVIQAKRYTNVVGVSAVRDLYGTLQHEGANKGILVTTSDYGPDAYEFARGKPLTLLSGANLLHLLNKHGHKARIDLAEARKKLAEEMADIGRSPRWNAGANKIT